ncbi:MAG: FecR domain-containing protein [Steroidobacteraceae bacterium]
MLSRYTTGSGAGSRMELEDGTPVMLNAATEIAVSFSDQLRFVNVLRGEASFAVRPDSYRPFRVRAAGRDLAANSTVLDVRVLAAKAAALTVLKGTAVVSAVDPRASDTNVGPLESLQFGPNQQSRHAISAAEAQVQLAWQASLPR